MIRTILLVFFSCLIATTLQAQQVRTVEVYSEKMGETIKNIVVVPEQYESSDEARYPVVYLLHGHGGNETTFPKHTKKNLPEDASRLNMIFVCPDGKSSWYWDSPLDSTLQYETYVSKELVKYIDDNFRTIASPSARAITGFSMGGHGGLFLGINHPDVFGACGSMSGGVDIRPFPRSWEMYKSLGRYQDNPTVWDEHTVMTQVPKIDSGKLAIIFDCGTDDFFYEVNQELHKQLIYYNIPHDYIERPGGHNHEYWNNSLDYQLLFFSKFFNK